MYFKEARFMYQGNPSNWDNDKDMNKYWYNFDFISARQCLTNEDYKEKLGKYAVFHIKLDDIKIKLDK